MTLQRATLDRPVSLVWIRAVPQGGAAPRAPSTVARRLWGHTELKWREDTQTSNDEAVSTEVTHFLIVKTIRRGGGRGRSWGRGRGVKVRRGRGAEKFVFWLLGQERRGWALCYAALPLRRPPSLLFGFLMTSARSMACPPFPPLEAKVPPPTTTLPQPSTSSQHTLHASLCRCCGPWVLPSWRESGLFDVR